MYLKIDYLIEKNNKTTVSNNIALRKVNVKSCGFDKTWSFINITIVKIAFISLRQPRLTKVLEDHLLKTKKEFKSLKN